MLEDFDFPKRSFMRLLPSPTAFLDFASTMMGSDASVLVVCGGLMGEYQRLSRVFGGEANVIQNLLADGESEVSKGLSAAQARQRGGRIFHHSLLRI